MKREEEPLRATLDEPYHFKGVWFMKPPYLSKAQDKMTWVHHSKSDPLFQVMD